MTAPRAMTFTARPTPPPTAPDQGTKAPRHQGVEAPRHHDGLTYDPIMRDLVAGMGERRHRVVRRVAEPAPAGGAAGGEIEAPRRPPVAALALIGAGAVAVAAAVFLGRAAPTAEAEPAPAGGVSPAPVAPEGVSLWT